MSPTSLVVEEEPSANYSQKAAHSVLGIAMCWGRRRGERRRMMFHIFLPSTVKKGKNKSSDLQVKFLRDMDRATSASGGRGERSRDFGSRLQQLLGSLGLPGGDPLFKFSSIFRREFFYNSNGGSDRLGQPKVVMRSEFCLENSISVCMT